MNRKQQLHRHCVQILQDRVQQAQEAMDAAQRDANSETKSSAGDKYETGRAMAHLDKERHTRTHASALNDLYRLQQVSVTDVCSEIEVGALVSTNRGRYYLVVGLGKVVVDGVSYQVVSPEAPMGAFLLEAEVGDVEDFRGQTMEIISVE